MDTLYRVVEGLIGSWRENGKECGHIMSGYVGLYRDNEAAI